MSTPDAKPDSAPPVPQAGEVLTLDDVRKADFTGVTPLGVLGFPIKHSVSPQMHNAALKVLAETDPKFKTWRYYRIEVPPEKLKEALDLLAEKGFIGLNLTIPHKVLALEWVKLADNMARASGAVNTLLRKDGRWFGYNTDGVGLMTALQLKPFSFESLENLDVVLLGAGGAARAIAAICLTYHCRSLWIGNRSAGRLDELISQLKIYGKIENVHGFDLSNIQPQLLPKNALVINATSLGLKREDSSPIDLTIFGSETMVFDTTYGKHRSQLLKQADELGMTSSNGVPMLVSQGFAALDTWTGISDRFTISVPAMFAAAHEALGIPSTRIEHTSNVFPNRTKISSTDEQG